MKGRGERATAKVNEGEEEGEGRRGGKGRGVPATGMENKKPSDGRE